MGAPGRIAALALLREQRAGRPRVTQRARCAGTPSSSAAATTGWSAAPTWRGAACGRSSSSGARRSAARWPPRRSLPGARVPAVRPHRRPAARPSVARDLGLLGHGLRLVQPAARVTSLRADGPPITLWGDAARTAAGLAAISRPDAAAWPAFDAEVRDAGGRAVAADGA